MTCATTLNGLNLLRWSIVVKWNVYLLSSFVPPWYCSLIVSYDLLYVNNVPFSLFFICLFYLVLIKFCMSCRGTKIQASVVLLGRLFMMRYAKEYKATPHQFRLLFLQTLGCITLLALIQLLTLILYRLARLCYLFCYLMAMSANNLCERWYVLAINTCIYAAFV